MARLGPEIRSGIHTGEVELLDGDVAGLAVPIAARVVDFGNGSEVLVSRTVKGLVTGSGLPLAGRGEHVLKGVPDRREVFALDGDSATGDSR